MAATCSEGNVRSKDPDAVLDYTFDWKALTNGSPGAVSDWLDTNEEIDSHSITADAGITVELDVAASSNTAIVVWLSGGTVGETYDVTCHIVTNSAPIAREEDMTLSITIVEK